jgi:hypothetical protein
VKDSRSAIKAKADRGCSGDHDAGGIHFILGSQRWSTVVKRPDCSALIAPRLAQSGEHAVPASRLAALAPAVSLACLIAATGAQPRGGDTAAQAYPNRAVRIVVPFPAGGPTDILSRVVAQRLSEVWGQPVVIENQPGANTAIAAARVAKLPADGYTLLAAMDVTMVLNPVTNKNLSYDPLKDFAPITLSSKST